MCRSWLLTPVSGARDNRPPRDNHNRPANAVKPNEDSITVLHFGSIQSSELDELREALRAVSDSVELRERQQQPQGNVEWALPTAVAIFVAGPFVAGFLGRLGGKAADATTKVFSNVYDRIKGRSKWQRSESKAFSGPVMSIELANALPDQQAQIVFIFPPGMSQRQFSSALSRCPALLRRERNRGRRYFQPAGTYLGYIERSVKFYYQHRWKRVWPTLTDWEDDFRNDSATTRKRIRARIAALKAKKRARRRV